MKENLITVFMERAELYGSRDVFRYKDKNSGHYKSISWEDMIAQTQKVSGALISLGYGYADNIGIISENRPEWVISDLGIIGIRGVVVPFYATSSKQQLKYIVDETQMKLIFAGA